MSDLCIMLGVWSRFTSSLVSSLSLRLCSPAQHWRIYMKNCILSEGEEDIYGEIITGVRDETRMEFICSNTTFNNRLHSSSLNCFLRHSTVEFLTIQDEQHTTIQTFHVESTFYAFVSSTFTKRSATSSSFYST